MWLLYKAVRASSINMPEVNLCHFIKRQVLVVLPFDPHELGSNSPLWLHSIEIPGKDHMAGESGH